jgi:nitroreductase
LTLTPHGKSAPDRYIGGMTITHLLATLPVENDILPAPAPDAGLLAFLATRRSSKVGQLGAPGPDRETLEAILKLAVRVPDHGKMAPWRFLVIGSDAAVALGEKAAAIAVANNPQADDTLAAFEWGRFTRAPVCLAVISSPRPNPKVPIWEQELSAGALCHNICLAARGFGFGATWLTEWVAFDRAFAAHLGLSDAERIAGFIYFGTPTEAPTERPRPDVSKLTTWL